VPLITEEIPGATGDELQAIAEILKGQFKGVTVLAGAAAGQVALVAAVHPDFAGKAAAGKIIQSIAPLVGGKGGGRPDLARGAGKDASQLSAALAQVETLL
jgi:alanyl-tRNA synthetase